MPTYIFGELVSHCDTIANEVLMVLRSNKKLQNEVSLHEPIGFDKEGNEVNLLDLLENDQDDVTERIELKGQIKKLYCAMKDVLRKREKLVLELRYGLCGRTSKTQREIAKSLGISRSYVYGVWYCKQGLETLETTGFASLTVFGDMTTLNVSRKWIKALKNA